MGVSVESHLHGRGPLKFSPIGITVNNGMKVINHTVVMSGDYLCLTLPLSHDHKKTFWGNGDRHCPIGI